MFLTLEEVQQNVSEVRKAINGRRHVFELDDLPADNLTYYDFIYTLMKRVRKPEPIYLECGVWTGRSISVAHAARPEAVLVGIDIREPPRVFDDNDVLKKQTIYCKGDTRNVELSEKLKEALEGRGIDVLFLDSTHDYETVVQEWVLYFPLLDQESGVVLFDDIALENQIRTNINTIGTYSFVDYAREPQDKKALSDTERSVRQAFHDLSNGYPDWAFEIIETGYHNNPAVGIVYRRNE